MRLIRWLATVGAVGLVSIFLSQRHAIDPVQNLTLSVSAPVEGVFHDAASPLNDVYEGIADRGSLREENEQLRQQLEQLQSQLAAQQDAQIRIAELEQAVGVKQSRPDDQLLVANVIAQEPSALKRMMAIDRGTADDLDEGMVVLSGNGSLVGTVARVYEDYAWVRLITDPDSAVNAAVNLIGSDASVLTPGGTPTPAPSSTSAPAPPAAATVTSVRGVAEGTLRDEVMLDLLPPEVQINEGSLVVTSGLGGNYPAGLLIGSVTEVEQRPQSAFKRASLEPATQLSELETVLVLVNFRPARLVSP
jgi:rod shape-determining protein MreC